ncbi:MULTISPECIES: hypothetical protein [Asaia]|uniref:Uncharacterized protein n=1 Tax=Asaia spathodeae TaxID=657016 RepID=A0ABX2P8W5_9PROT|nr:hypothetical protein [Asaia spathodeae]
MSLLRARRLGARCNWAHDHTMRRFLTTTLLCGFTLLSACAGKGEDTVLQNRSPSVLLTSYAIANGMAEHGMITRILQHKATKADIARLIAVDHNTWQLIRQAAYSPTDQNFRLADAGIVQILDYATPVPQPSDGVTPGASSPAAP